MLGCNFAQRISLNPRHFPLGYFGLELRSECKTEPRPARRLGETCPRAAAARCPKSPRLTGASEDFVADRASRCLGRRLDVSCHRGSPHPDSSPLHRTMLKNRVTEAADSRQVGGRKPYQNQGVREDSAIRIPAVPGAQLKVLLGDQVRRPGRSRVVCVNHCGNAHEFRSRPPAGPDRAWSLLR